MFDDYVTGIGISYSINTKVGILYKHVYQCVERCESLGWDINNEIITV